jgi:hypothetical protein
MAKRPITLTQGFYVSESLPISAQRCVNWMPNVPQTSTITDANLFPTEGLNKLVSISDLPQNTGRGTHTMAEISYSVIGQTLYRLNRIVVQGQEDSFTYDALGTVEGGDPVSMDDNGDQLCIVARPDNSTTGKSYIFTEPSSLVEITDPDFDGPATSVIF